MAGFLFGCGPSVVFGDDDAKPDPRDDIAQALAALPNAEVIEATPDGVPTYIIGEMAKIGEGQTDDLAAAEAALRPALPPVVAPFRLTVDDLHLRRVNVDGDGNRHYRYRQTADGLDVIGGDLVVHVDIKGSVYGINGAARGDLPSDTTATIDDRDAVARIASDSRFTGMSTSSTRLVYLITADSARHRAYETVVTGMRGKDPVRDKVYVDVTDGAIVADYPQIYFAENRKAYSANNGTSLPGTLKRSEGQAPNADIDINAAYDGTGDAWEAYHGFWGRDSYDNAGAVLISSVHYSTNYCNAYWDSTQMVYGDGSGSSCLPLARAVDVTAHELTHAVTERESGLVYSGESGGMNEAISDIFGAFTEAWVDGGKTGTLAVSADTWKVGEDILPPGLRFMCDPASDSASLDFWTSSAGNVDVHYSSGIGNLAFCLLSQGGTHPRGKSTTVVPAIGMDQAIRILYEAQINYITSSAKFANVRTAMEQATTALGYPQATKDAVGCAWAAVGVGTAPTSCGGGGGGGGGGDVTLTNNVPVGGLSDSTGGQKFFKLDVPSGQTSLVFTISGGTGDADMYVKSGVKPTLTLYDCRPYINGNSETCTFTPPAAGTYWVMLNAYASYSGVTVKGSYTSTGGGGDPYLTNGVAVGGIGGATGSNKFWRVTTPSGKHLTIKISGGTGDADLYTRFASRPTTSSYACRPYLTGNNETCTTASTQAGDYYVMLRGYATYSGVSLIASF